MPEWMDRDLAFGFTPGELLVAAAAAAGAYLVMAIGLRLAQSRLRGLAERTDTRVDNAIATVLAGTNRLLIVVAALLVGVGMLDLPDRWAARVGQLWFVALAIQAGLWAGRLVGIVLRRHAERHVPGGGPPSAAATLVSWGARTALWAVVLLAVLSNLGVDITAFVASLGIGGIAVALAAQTVLADLFASLSIAIDKPFEVGDFIVSGPIIGSVEHVGIKTTRIRSLAGEQVVVSNTELLKQTISNYKRLQHRRIEFNFGVSRETSAEQAAEIPAILRHIVEGSERLRFDRAHLKAFGDSSLDYQLVYFVLDPDYNLYMDEQQRINLALMQELQDRGIALSLPVRSWVMADSRHREDAQHPRERLPAPAVRPQSSRAPA